MKEFQLKKIYWLPLISLLLLPFRQPLTLIGNFGNFLSGFLLGLSFFIFLISCLVKICFSKKVYFPNIKKQPTVILIFLYVFYMVLRMLTSFLQQKPFVVFLEGANYLAFIIIFLIIYFFIKEEKTIKIFINSFFVSSFIVAFLGVLQAIFNFSYGRLGEVPSTVSSFPIRLSSTVGAPLHLGAYFALLLPIVLNFLSYLKLNKSNWGKYIFVLIIIFAMIFVLIGTQSRGAWVQLLISCIALFLISSSFRKFILNPLSMLFIIIIIMFLFFSDGSDLFQRLSSIFNWANEDSNIQRIESWKSSLKVWYTNPISVVFGEGLEGAGNIVNYFNINTQPLITESYMLKIILNFGLIGFLIFLTMYFCIVHTGLRLSHEKLIYGDKLWLFQGITTSLIGFFIILWPMQVFQAPVVSGTFWFFVGILAFYEHKNKKIIIT